jgi:hypothetical protein
MEQTMITTYLPDRKFVCRWYDKKYFMGKEWIPSKKQYFKSVIGYLILLWSIIFVF